MAKVLMVLCSHRRKGFTAGLLQAATEGVMCVDGVEANVVHAFDYSFSPCRSCFCCIRNPQHVCVQGDGLGRDGDLHEAVASCNGLLIADAVHFWGPTAMCHTFVERLYPFLWSGNLNGLPFASISCASNQGMQHLACQTICKWAFGLGMRYIGGVAAHTALYEQALCEARDIGRRLALAVWEDAQCGRKRFASDEEKWLAYGTTPWTPVKPYLCNLCGESSDVDDSIIARALREGTFHREDAVSLLRHALPLLARAMECYEAQDEVQAARHLVAASAYWTHATWKEFLEEKMVQCEQPEAYRPLPRGEDG